MNAADNAETGVHVDLDCSSLESERTASTAPQKTPPKVPDYSSAGTLSGISLTLHYAVESERAIVNILWHYPEFLGLAQRELDPRVHFTLPSCRLVLEAMALANEKCLPVCWQSVLECICEIREAFEECGRREGLSQIFTDDGHYPEGPRANLVEPILRYHIDYLRSAAILRGIDPAKPLEFFHTGWGHLVRNKLATNPIATGKVGCAYCGKTNDLAAKLEGENLKLKTTPTRR
jgi:hypothetical protein